MFQCFFVNSHYTEALRKYPIVPILNRTCVSDYKIGSTGQTIEKGVEIFIPVFAMHRDEKYYPNPLKFDPERFNEGNSAGKNQTNRPYLPFGDGKCFEFRFFCSGVDEAS